VPAGQVGDVSANGSCSRLDGPQPERTLRAQPVRTLELRPERTLGLGRLAISGGRLGRARAPGAPPDTLPPQRQRSLLRGTLRVAQRDRSRRQLGSLWMQQLAPRTQLWRGIQRAEGKRRLGCMRPQAERERAHRRCLNVAERMQSGRWRSRSRSRSKSRRARGVTSRRRARLVHPRRMASGDGRIRSRPGIAAAALATRTAASPRQGQPSARCRSTRTKQQSARAPTQAPPPSRPQPPPSCPRLRSSWRAGETILAQWLRPCPGHQTDSPQLPCRAGWPCRAVCRFNPRRARLPLLLRTRAALGASRGLRAC
jgi:hypothetical protein